MNAQDGKTEIRCLIFDFDGVLVNSTAVKRRAYFDIFAYIPAAHPIVEAVLVNRQDGDRFQVITQVLEQLERKGLFSLGDHIDELVARYADQYNHICEDYAVNCTEIKGVSTSLPRLARCYSLYVVSDTPEEPLRQIVDKRGWTCHFRDVFGRPRTKEENIGRILDRESIDGSHTMFVGDSGRDLEAAIRCKSQFIGMRSDENDFDRLSLVVVENFSQLEMTLERLQA